ITDGTCLQNMWCMNAGVPDRRDFGADRLATFQRLPAPFLQVAPTAAGPGTFSMEASVAQFAPMAPPSEQERSTGFGYTDLGGRTPLNAGHVARGPALRFDLAPG